MKRVTYNWRERLDTALGSLFPFYLLGAAGFLLFARALLPSYLLVGAITFLVFFVLCPWLPGNRGLTKVMVLEGVLACALLANELFSAKGLPSIRAELIIAMVMLMIYGSELGGLASTMPSDLDPFLARLGVAGVGNVSFAGTVRTDLLTGLRDLTHDRDRCVGCGQCHEVCPQGVWEMDGENRAVLANRDRCTACRACLVQCPSGAVQAPLMQPLEAKSTSEPVSYHMNFPRQ